jgi:hypothetical protein
MGGGGAAIGRRGTCALKRFDLEACEVDQDVFRIGYIPPTEAEERYYAQFNTLDMVA